MRKIILTFAVMFMTLSVSAQQGNGGRRQFNPTEMAQRQANRLKEACSLTDEQLEAVQNIYLEQAKAMQAERDSLAKSGDSARPRMNPDSFRKRAEATDAKIKAILTEEQVAAYEKLQKERGNRQGGNGGRGRRN